MPTYKIFSFFYGYGFFPKLKFIMHLLLTKCKKKHIFWMDFQPKLVNIYMLLNLIYVHQYCSPSKNSLQNSTHNFSFEVYL
jgi:hypothetical protein